MDAVATSSPGRRAASDTPGTPDEHGAEPVEDPAAEAAREAAWRRERLLEHLRRQGGACSACDYDLCGQAVDRCPECGTRLELRVGPASLNVHGFVLLLLPFAFSGMAAILLIGRAIALAILAAGGGRPPSQTVVTLTAFGVLSGLVGLELAVRPRAWLRGPRRRQWSLVGIAWTVHIAVLAGLVILRLS